MAAAVHGATERQGHGVGEQAQPGLAEATL